MVTALFTDLMSDGELLDRWQTELDYLEPATLTAIETALNVRGYRTRSRIGAATALLLHPRR